MTLVPTLGLPPILIGDGSSRHGVITGLLKRLRFSSSPDAAMNDLDMAGQIIALSRDGVLISSLNASDLALTHVNHAFERITGYGRDEVVGKNCRYLQGSDRLQPEIAVMRTAIAERRMTTVTLRNYRKDGTLFWNEVVLCPLLDGLGNATHYLGLIRDVTAMRDMASRLDAAARLDPLTGALNRHAFIDAVDLLRAGCSGRILIAKLDILSLQEVNSGYGYDAGDALIMQVARRLSETGAPLLGQFAERKFILAQVLQTAAEGDAVLAGISAAMEPPFTLPGTVVRARFALGYVIGDPTSSALSLTRQAASALRQSRARRVNDPRQSERGAAQFDHESELAMRRRIRLTAELQQALQDGDFLYQYQPKVDLRTGQIIGAEALIRWKHSLFGLQTPSVFIQIAEETHLILDIEARGLRDVAAFAARVNPGRSKALVFSINISPIELTQRDLVALVRDVLAETGADPAWIALELTEGILTESSPDVLGVLRALRGLGVGLAIDDFGTGHSSLRYLDTFPMSEIKIDQSFVRDLRDNGVKRIIAEAVIALGRHLGVDVVAEGIETEAEKTLLLEMHCPAGQGYLFSRPVDGKAFLEMVRQADAADAGG